jgi:toxin CcdB
MARFDIFRNPGKNQLKVPYLLDVQSNVVSGLTTRVVIPLRPLVELSAVAPPADLFPTIMVNGVEYYLDTPQLGAILVRELKTKVGSALHQQSEILAALDRLFGAY